MKFSKTVYASVYAVRKGNSSPLRVELCRSVVTPESVDLEIIAGDMKVSFELNKEGAMAIASNLITMSQLDYEHPKEDE